MPTRKKIYLGLFSACLLMASLLWSPLGVQEFPGSWMCKTFLLILGSINLIGAFFLSAPVAKALLAINSVGVSLLFLEIWFSNMDATMQSPASRLRIYKPKTVSQIAKTIDDVDILAIGDSFTRGVNVGPRFAWPTRLQGMTGRNVLNWSEGGFSPAEYWRLFEQGLKNKADTIIVGFYFGNDVWGAFNTVYKDHQYHQFRTQSALQFQDRVEEQTKALWAAIHGMNSKSDPSVGFWTAFRNRSAIVRLITTVQSAPENRSAYSSQKAWVIANPQHGSFYENGKVRTIFMTSYRLAGEDLDNPVNREGLRLVEMFLAKMQAGALKSGTHFLLLLIPSKEMVFADLLRSQKGLDPVFAKLIANETRLLQIIRDICKRERIPEVDALPYLSSIAATTQIYREVADGHPVGSGYLQIAAAVYDKLKELGWLENQSP